LALAREFLRERLEQNQSVIYLALDPEGSAFGVTQLYPSFSSASAKRIFILNDLFVDPAARRSIPQLPLGALAISSAQGTQKGDRRHFRPTSPCCQHQIENVVSPLFMAG
jgi:hypothetical protein